MNIGLDFHGVIADGAALKSAVLRVFHNVTVSPRLCRSEYLVGGGYVTREVYEDVLRRVYEDPDGHSLVTPMPRAIDAIRLLMARKHSLCVITASDEPAGRNVVPWLNQHGLDLPVTCVGRNGDKSEACKGLDIFVDDDLSQLLRIKHRGLKKILFGTQSHQRPKLWTPNGIRRALNWEQLLVDHLRLARVA